MDLKEFLQLATKRERAEVAIVCNHSVSYLYQLAVTWSNGFVQPS